MNFRNKIRAACKLKKKKNWGPVSFLVSHPKKSSLLNIQTTGQGLETTQVCSSSHPSSWHTGIQRTHSELISSSHPKNPERGILTEDIFTSLRVALSAHACVGGGSLHHTHRAARGVDCPGHGVLTVVHNVCLHHALRGWRDRYTQN